MDKLIINTAAADYTSVICAFIRDGFSVNQFTIKNDLLIVEIDSHRDVRVSNCVHEIIAQSIYEIATALRIDNITVQHDDVAFTISDGCYFAAIESVVSLDCVYDGVAKARVNRIKSMRAEDLSKCYAIVQAEQLAEDIAFNIRFYGCKKRLYDIDYSQYDALTLCNRLAQLGIKSYIKSNTHALVIA